MKQADVLDSIAHGPVSRLQILVLSICWFINLLDGFDILIISFTAADIVQEWSLAPDQLGIVFSGGLFGMMLGAILIAPFADQFGRKTILIACLGIISGSMIATAFVDSVEMLLVFRVTTGLGVGGVLPNINTLVAEFAPLKKRNLAISALQIAYPVGAIVAGFLFAFLTPVWGWRMPYLMGGLLTLILIPIVWRVLPESVHYLLESQKPGALEALNKVLVSMGREPLESMPPREEKVGITARPGIIQLLSEQYRGRTFLLLTAFFMTMLVFYFILSWTPVIIEDAGLDPSFGVLGGTLLNVGGIVGILIMGYLSGEFGLRRVLVSIFVLEAFFMGLFAIGAGANPYYVMGVLMFLGGCAHGGIVGLYATAAWIFPTRLRATGLGWSLGLGRTGAIIGPYVAGLLMAFGLSRETYFLVLGLPLIFAAISLLLIQGQGLDRAGGSSKVPLVAE